MNVLFLWLLLAAGQAVEALDSNFTSVATCPVNVESLSLVEGISHARTCRIECALRSDCAVIFMQDPLKCYLGNGSQYMSTWRALGTPSCRSFVIASRIPDLAQILPALTPSIRAFYNFRLGLRNLANPGRFNLTPYDIRFTERGAYFKGHRGSYIEVDTESSQLVAGMDWGDTFSFFAKVRRSFAGVTTTTKSFYYHSFMSCSYGVSGGNFKEVFSKSLMKSSISVEQQFKISRVQVSDLSMRSLPLEDKDELMIAVGFNGTDFSNFFFNTSSLPHLMHSHFSYNYSSNWNDCLKLGFYPSSDTSCLRGHIVCYGLATRILTDEELNQLSDIC